MEGDECWGLLCRYRARLLLAAVPSGTDRNEELKRRLRLWERAQMNELILRGAGHQINTALPLQSRVRGLMKKKRKANRPAPPWYIGPAVSLCGLCLHLNAS